MTAPGTQRDPAPTAEGTNNATRHDGHETARIPVHRRRGKRGVPGVVAGKAAAKAAAPKPSASIPPAATAAAESQPPREAQVTEGRSGSDFMVDVIKSLEIEYIAAMPGSTFRGLHESVINYGGNQQTRTADMPA